MCDRFLKKEKNFVFYEIIELKAGVTYTSDKNIMFICNKFHELLVAMV